MTLAQCYTLEQTRQAVARATRKARVSGRPWAVAEIGERITVVDLHWLSSGEYNHVVLAVVSPDGRVRGTV